MPEAKVLFSAHGLAKRFHGLLATDDVSFEVADRQIHALIGPNGAGKSTLVNLVSGLLPADAGRIVLAGTELTRLSAHRRVRAGLSRSFQITSIFRDLTVRDNLLLAAQSHSGSSFRFLSRRSSEHGLRDTAEALAERVGLGASLGAAAGTLSHGSQRRLDLALALAAKPKLLLLDEPLAGMGPEDSASMTGLIRELRADMAILLIEHDMDAVFQLADRISVLVRGRVLTSGTVAEVRANAEVQAVYLGVEPVAVAEPASA